MTKPVDGEVMIDVNARAANKPPTLIPQKHLILGTDWPEAMRIYTSIPRALRAFIEKGRRRTRKKTSNWQECLGCSIEQLHDHLEKQFEDGMTWDNYGQGGWQIRYIKSLSEFDMRTLDARKEAFNFKNMRPGSPHDHAFNSKSFSPGALNMPPAPRSDAEAYAQMMGIFEK